MSSGGSRLTNSTSLIDPVPVAGLSSAHSVSRLGHIDRASGARAGCPRRSSRSAGGRWAGVWDVGIRRRTRASRKGECTPGQTNRQRCVQRRPTSASESPAGGEGGYKEEGPSTLGRPRTPLFPPWVSSDEIVAIRLARGNRVVATGRSVAEALAGSEAAPKTKAMAGKRRGFRAKYVPVGSAQETVTMTRVDEQRHPRARPRGALDHVRSASSP